jgi:hypothetical protein
MKGFPMIFPLVIVAALIAPPVPVPPECRDAEQLWLGAVSRLARDPMQESYRVYLSWARAVLDNCIAVNQGDA